MKFERIKLLAGFLNKAKTTKKKVSIHFNATPEAFQLVLEISRKDVKGELSDVADYLNGLALSDLKETTKKA